MTTGRGLSTNGGGDMRDQIDGVEYRERRIIKPMIVVGILTTLGMGGAMAVKPPGFAWLAGSVVLANILFWIYLMGPVAVVTVRWDTLEVNNAIFKYMIPRARIVAVEPDGAHTILVRAEPDWCISIGAFESPFASDIRSASEQAEEARRLETVLAAHAPVDDHRAVTRSVRWANPLGVCLGIIGMLAIAFLSEN